MNGLICYIITHFGRILVSVWVCDKFRVKRIVQKLLCTLLQKMSLLVFFIKYEFLKRKCYCFFFENYCQYILRCSKNTAVGWWWRSDSLKDRIMRVDKLVVNGQHQFQIKSASTHMGLQDVRVSIGTVTISYLYHCMVSNLKKRKQ